MENQVMENQVVENQVVENQVVETEIVQNQILGNRETHSETVITTRAARRTMLETQDASSQA